MKTALGLFATALLVGCTSQRPAQPARPVTPISTPVVPGSSSALLFDPPLTRVSPPIDLDRTGRGPAAFVGFEQATTSSYDVWTYNNESTDGCDDFNRATLVDKVGTVSR